MKFNSYEERKRHPQAGMIPDYVWDEDFYNSIDDELLELMSLSEEELCDEQMEMDLDINEKYDISIVIFLILVSHPNLSTSALNIIVNKAGIGFCQTFCVAAMCGRIEILRHLDDLFPNELQVMIKRGDYYAFTRAAATGQIKVLEYLGTKIQPKEALQDMINTRDDDGPYCAFREAAKRGHLNVLEYLETKIQPKEALQDMIKADNYSAFCNAAERGQIKVLEYLGTKIQPPEALQDMIKVNNYRAFRLAAHNGHLNALEYLAGKAPHLLQDMIKADDYNAFRWAAHNGHASVLEYLGTKIQPKEALQDMIKVKDYRAFHLAAQNGHLNALEYLAGKAPGLLQDMIKADDYDAFRLAAQNGHASVLEYLETKIQPKEALQDMIKADNYSAFRLAAQNGHATALNFLMRYNTVRTESFRLIASSGLSSDIWTTSSRLDLKELLKHPAIFEHACSHNPDKIEPFIVEQIQDLWDRKQHGNPLHLLHNKQEAECLFYLLHCLIDKAGVEAKNYILFLLNIKEVHAILPTRRPPQNTTNLALRAAITQRRSARENAAIWNEIISTFYAIPEVRAQALLDNDYPAETQGQIDLRAIASNIESSMQALTAEEEAELKQLRDHYLPQIQQLNTSHSNLAWVNVLNCFENYYNENPAKFTNTKGEVITLPLEWDDFKNLNLSEEDNKLAREAYYQNKAHTAYRFFLRPNPWLASNASHVVIVDTNGGQAANYENLKEVITLLTLAAFDDKMKPLDGSGFDLTGRINTFVDAIALMNRAHNWDKTRERTVIYSQQLDFWRGANERDEGVYTQYMTEGERVCNKAESSRAKSIKEHYDDLEGDKPSCLPGMKKRLIQSLIAHPLFISTDVIAEEAVRSELQNIIKDKITTLDNTALTNLHDYLQDMIITGSSDIPAVTLLFDETCHQTLMANILKKYFWLDAEILKSEIVKKLKALGLVKEAPINKNLFITGDFFTYTQKQIRNIAKEKNIVLLASKTEDVETQKELSVLESVKHLVAYYCEQTPALSRSLAIFANATNEQKLKDAWEQWTPDSTPTHNFAKDLQIRYPGLFVAKRTPGQMTYDDLPDWYQKLAQEEAEAQNQQSSRYRLFGLPPALSPFETHATHAPQGENGFSSGNLGIFTPNHP